MSEPNFLSVFNDTIEAIAKLDGCAQVEAIRAVPVFKVITAISTIAGASWKVDDLPEFVATVVEDRDNFKHQLEAERSSMAVERAELSAATEGLERRICEMKQALATGARQRELHASHLRRLLGDHFAHVPVEGTELPHLLDHLEDLLKSHMPRIPAVVGTGLQAAVGHVVRLRRPALWADDTIWNLRERPPTSYAGIHISDHAREIELLPDVVGRYIVAASHGGVGYVSEIDVLPAEPPAA